MLKATFGWCCVLMSLAGLWTISPALTARSTAQESASVSASAATSASKAVRLSSQTVARISSRSIAEERIDSVLDQRLKSSLEFDAERLNIVLEMLAEEYQIPIVIDKAGLDEVAISAESEVTINVRDISLRSALNLIFKEPGLEDLAYSIQDEVLLITTEDRRNERLIARVYRIDDILRGGSASRNSSKGDLDPNYLIGILISCIDHDSWMENGTGDGEVQYVQPGMLVVSQTRHIHRQVSNLLREIRATKHVILSEQVDH